MAQPRVLVLRAPGTNCDVETAYAFERAGARAERVHVNRLLEDRHAIDAFQIVCIPGGFSYGDDLAAGRILGNQIRHYLADCLAKFKADGKLILGICNGFQVLLKTDVLLEPRPEGGPLATLAPNDSGRYEDRWVHLRVADSPCVFFTGIESMYLPVAHAEGKFVTADASLLDGLRERGQLVLRYASARGDGAEIAYPENPNGSQAHVAGVCDPTGRVCGMMPHPERYIEPTQHPRWTRGDAPAEGDGLQVFRNAVAYFG